MTPSKRTRVPACVSSSAAERARCLARGPLVRRGRARGRSRRGSSACRRRYGRRRTRENVRTSELCPRRRRACVRARCASARRASRRRASGGSRPCARRGRAPRRPRRSSAPPATRSATRRSAGVRPSLRVRPPIAPELLAGPRSAQPLGADLLEAGSREPRSPRAPAASAARAAASTPSASSARARPNGSPTASCCSTASASRFTAAVDVAPRRGDEAAAARRRAPAPRRDRAAAQPPPTRPDGRPHRRRGRARAAPRPARPATSCIVGSAPSAASVISSADREAVDGCGRRPAPELDEPERRQRPVQARRVELGQPAASPRRARERAARSPRWAAMSVSGNRLVGDSTSSRTYGPFSCRDCSRVLLRQRVVARSAARRSPGTRARRRPFARRARSSPRRGSRAARGRGRAGPTRGGRARAGSQRPRRPATRRRRGRARTPARRARAPRACLR